jgi:hypothetical protein
MGSLMQFVFMLVSRLEYYLIVEGVSLHLNEV